MGRDDVLARIRCNGSRGFTMFGCAVVCGFGHYEFCFLRVLIMLGLDWCECEGLRRRLLVMHLAGEGV